MPSERSRATLGRAITETVRACCAETDQPHALHAPVFEGNENAYLRECVDTG